MPKLLRSSRARGAGRPVAVGYQSREVLSYLDSGMSEQEILDDFPELTREDILACLSYAADMERKTKVAL